MPVTVVTAASGQYETTLMSEMEKSEAPTCLLYTSVSYLDENANEIDAAEKILREIKPKGIIFLGGSVANFQRGFDRINVPSVLTTRCV